MNSQRLELWIFSSLHACKASKNKPTKIVAVCPGNYGAISNSSWHNHFLCVSVHFKMFTECPQLYTWFSCNDVNYHSSKSCIETLDYLSVHLLPECVLVLLVINSFLSWLLIFLLTSPKFPRFLNNRKHKNFFFLTGKNTMNTTSDWFRHEGKGHVLVLSVLELKMLNGSC